MRRLSLLIVLFLTIALPAEARYVHVTWEAVAGATSYNLYWGTVSGGPYPYYLIGATDGLTTNETNLAIDETEVYMVVTAVDGTGESAESDEIFISYLAQDGYPTPEQISMFLPDDTFPSTMTATLRYRKAGVETWTTGHDLYQIQENITEEGFTWTIFDLDQGSDYVVEVTTHDGEDEVIYTRLMSTSSLPGEAGLPSTTIPAGSNSAYIEAVFDAAVPGDVIEFEDGTYNIDDMDIRCSGSSSDPIYIRGESRDGVILSDTTRAVLYFNSNNNIVLENLTIQGSGTDSGVSSSSTGIGYWGGYTGTGLKGNITFRYLTITGVDMGIVVTTEAKQMLIYENVLQGNNTWTQDLYAMDGGSPDGTPDIEQRTMWNDDGIRVPGQGNAVFNNTLDGFGDAFAVADGYVNVADHFYRNKVTMTGDDGIETDYVRRNLSFYDNHLTNVGTAFSCDKTYGGPVMVFRNIVINTIRQVYKINSAPAVGFQSGLFFSNNTIVKTDSGQSASLDWGFLDYNDGALKDIGYQNNLLIYQNPIGNLAAIESTSLNPIDWTNNSWYPNGAVWWSQTGGSYSSMALAYAGLSATMPIFSGETQRMEDDLISEAQPFDTEVVLGANSRTEITTTYTPTLSTGGVSKNTGVAIIGVTGGFSGVAPDRGAIISGRSSVTYGAEESGETGTSPKIVVGERSL